MRKGLLVGLGLALVIGVLCYPVSAATYDIAPVQVQLRSGAEIAGYDCYPARTAPLEGDTFALVTLNTSKGAAFYECTLTTLTLLVMPHD